VTEATTTTAAAATTTKIIIQKARMLHLIHNTQEDYTLSAFNA
jgi:hypothetical protein